MGARKFVLTIFCKLSCCSRGVFLVDALIAVVLVGIAVLALLAAFGRSSDFGDASAEYIMANCLAQKQLEILKENTIHNKVYWDAQSLTTTYQNKPPVQGDSSPVTLIGSGSQFAIVNRAKLDANGNIDIICTVSWTSNSKTGTTKTRSSKLITQINYPST